MQVIGYRQQITVSDIGYYDVGIDNILETEHQGAQQIPPSIGMTELRQNDRIVVFAI